MIPHPTEVRSLEAEGLLRVTFSDDIVIDFPAAFLRGFCPCAKCQGHSGGPPTWTPWHGDRAVAIDNVSAVGNYGMNIVWGDGHDTGIYSFESLRRMDLDGFDSGKMTSETAMPSRGTD